MHLPQHRVSPTGGVTSARVTWSGNVCFSWCVQETIPVISMWCCFGLRSCHTGCVVQGSRSAQTVKGCNVYLLNYCSTCTLLDYFKSFATFTSFVFYAFWKQISFFSPFFLTNSLPPPELKILLILTFNIVPDSYSSTFTFSKVKFEHIIFTFTFV